MIEDTFTVAFESGRGMIMDGMKRTYLKNRVRSVVICLVLVIAMGAGVLVAGNSASAKKAAKKTVKIALSKKDLTVKAGNEKMLRLKGVPLKKFKKIKWSVSDASVTRVYTDSILGEAYVFGYKAGKAKVTAKYKKKTYTCKVTVKTGTSGKVYLPSEETGAGTDGNDYWDTAVYWSYKDSWFTAPASTYNQKIATISSILAWSSKPDYSEGTKGNTAYYVKRVTDMLGFTGFRTNDDYKVKPTTDSFGVAFAKKSIKSGDKTYTLIVIVPRSSGYEKEWASNLLLGSGTGDHEGFKKSSEKLVAGLKQYIVDEQISGDIKLWFAGHSRGATASNLAEAYIADHPGELSDAVYFTNEDIYGYNLSCLNATSYSSDDEKKKKETGYPFIHNIQMPHDIIPRLISESYGFTKYGETREIKVSKSDEGEAYTLLKSVDRAVWSIFYKNNPREQDADGLIAAFEAAMKKTIPDRQAYVDSFQADAIKAVEGSGEPWLAFTPVLLNMDYKGDANLNTVIIEHYLQVIYCFLTDYRMLG